MYRFLLLSSFLCLCLDGKDTDLIEFRCIAASDFSIELKAEKKDMHSTNILLHEFTAKEVKDNQKKESKIDSLYLTISDITTGSSLDRVYVWSSFVSGQNEFELNNSLNQRETLRVISDRDSKGKKAHTEIKSGSVIREILPGQTISPPEEHKLTFYAKKGTFAGKKGGLFQGEIHFVAVSES